MSIIIRDAYPTEYDKIGQLLVNVYSNLEGFPTPTNQPKYYKKLLNIGDLTNSATTLIVAQEDETIVGAALYITDMHYYGSRGAANALKNSAGFRFLAVALEAQGKGIGKLLCKECIHRTRQLGYGQLIIHSTEAMKTAWQLYLKLGFERTPALDFSWDGYGVYGFKLSIS